MNNTTPNCVRWALCICLFEFQLLRNHINLASSHLLRMQTRDILFHSKVRTGIFFFLRKDTLLRYAPP
jgi:hypothetical protein